MHEHKQNQCKRKVKNRKNVVGLIIFCITVGIVFLYAYYQNLRKEIDARQKWLETDGKMGIYRKESGKLIYKEKVDSEDGYLGMYLFLMGKYLEKTENTDLPEYWKKGISLALKKIQSLMRDGITQVSEENTTAYLMDNLEVWKGLHELELAGLEDTQAISEMRKKIQAQIENIFWDDANQRWRIIGNSDLYDQTEFYPDGVAQIYPLIYEFPVKEKKKQKILYEQFTERFQWQKLNKKRNGFL